MTGLSLSSESRDPWLVKRGQDNCSFLRTDPLFSIHVQSATRFVARWFFFLLRVNVQTLNLYWKHCHDNRSCREKSKHTHKRITSASICHSQRLIPHTHTHNLNILKLLSQPTFMFEANSSVYLHFKTQNTLKKKHQETKSAPFNLDVIKGIPCHKSLLASSLSLHSSSPVIIPTWRHFCEGGGGGGGVLFLWSVIICC